mgnify:CR=1 FL=1
MNAKVAKVIIWIFGLIGWLIVFLVDKTLLEDEGVKLYLNEMLIMFIANILLFWTFIVPIAYVVFWVWGLIYILQDKDEPLPLVSKLRIIK